MKYRCRNMIKAIVQAKNLPDGELNPGLPRDRRGYSPLYYRGFDIVQIFCVVFKSYKSQGSRHENLKYKHLMNRSWKRANCLIFVLVKCECQICKISCKQFKEISNINVNIYFFWIVAKQTMINSK